MADFFPMVEMMGHYFSLHYDRWNDPETQVVFFVPTTTTCSLFSSHCTGTSEV
jgi:hypothetical protein